MPGDPVTMFFGTEGVISEELYAKLKHELGLDQPIYVQYFIYIKNVLSGNLGYSVFYHRPVAEDFKQFLPATIELGLAASFIAIITGIPLGIICAIRRNKWVDHLVRVVSMTGVAMPAFWSAIMLQSIFYGELKILPVGGRLDAGIQLEMLTGLHVLDSILTMNWLALKSSLYHIILPAMTLSFSPFATLVKMSRTSMLDTLGQQYIRTERASGFSDKVIYFKYALRNALVPNLTVMGLVAAHMLRGAFLVEMIFNWPGIGLYTVTAISNSDYMPLVSVTLLMTIGYVLINLAVDTLYAVVDPRIKV